MENNYSIDEILLAVEEIRNKKSNKKNKFLKVEYVKKDYTSVPKSTLRLIEEAEK